MRPRIAWLQSGLAGLVLAAALAQTSAAQAAQAAAVFAGGCFWCMEEPFDRLPGVVSTTSGYIGGRVANPTYRQVTTGTTGHVEAVRVVYDPSRVSYETLLDVFWRNVDPFDGGGQFCDRGSQYASAIFALDADQRRAAEASKQAVAKRFGKPVATTIRAAATFNPAEDYHQNYYRTNALKYKFYRSRCGRDARLQALW